MFNIKVEGLDERPLASLLFSQAGFVVCIKKDPSPPIPLIRCWSIRLPPDR